VNMKVDGYSVFLHVALVALCLVVVLLGLENQRLRRSLEPPPSGPVIGQSVDSIRWQPLDGEEATLDLASGERESLLLVFTTDCPACRENQQAWKALHQEIGDAVNVVGISLSELEATRSYRDTHALSFPVGVPAKPQEFTESLAISGVPMTIRVGPDGRVRGSWSGTLSDRQLSELSKADRG